MDWQMQGWVGAAAGWAEQVCGCAGCSLPLGHSAQADADERLPGPEPAVQVTTQDRVSVGLRSACITSTGPCICDQLVHTR